MTKWLLAMKLTILFLTLAGLHAYARGFSQQTVNLSVNNTGLRRVFTLIEKETTYRFLYKDAVVPDSIRVSFHGSDVPVTEVLEKTLANTGLTYRLMDNGLVVVIPAGTTVKGVKVRGRVVDEKGNPLAGVSVSVSGINMGTTTDADGVFQLEVPGDATLVITSIGYKPVRIAVDGKTSLEVVLKSSAGGLDEVVVVGYATAKKVDVTGAVDQIPGKEVVDRPDGNVFESLQGMSPGLNITYNGGKPGSTPTYNIRGTTSINGGNPLIVINGIPATSDDMMRLNPSDVASFTILKDAASAAIYGSRASFGVIMITTKEGAKGKQVVSYNMFVSSEKPTLLPDPVTDPYIYSRILQMSTDATPWQYIKFTASQYQWAQQRSDDPSVPSTRLDPNAPTQWQYMGNNNFYNYFLNKHSISESHSVSISGSAQTAKKLPLSYYLSANYTKENGLDRLAKDDWDRYAMTARLTMSPLNWLKVDDNLNLYQTIATAPTTQLTGLYYLRPIDNAVNPDGTWANSSAGQLAAQLVDGGTSRANTFGFQNVARATGTFLHGDLQVTGDASVKLQELNSTAASLPYHIGYGPSDIRLVGGTGSVVETNDPVSDFVYDLYANYQKKLGNHTITVLAGYNQESYTENSITAERDGIITTSLPYIGVTTGTNTVTPSYGSWATQSYFGRIGYNFREKYILEANARQDGSSRFPSSNRWGFFPSISGAWIASHEDFFQHGRVSRVMSTLKFRASYGSLGNQNVSYYQYLQTLNTRVSGELINGAPTTVIGNASNGTVAPLLSIDPKSYTWEKVYTQNFGTDMGFWRDMFTLSFDYYVRNTVGMLAPSQPAPAVMGTAAPYENAANLQSKGWELSLGYRDVYHVGGKPMTFTARVILSDSKAFITKYNNPSEALNTYRTGQQIGEIWGLTNTGLFQNAGQIAKLDESAIIPWGSLSVVPGWPMYKDLNGDGKIVAGISAKNPGDLRIIGNSTARYLFGINLGWSWNGFDVSTFLQGVGKQDYYPESYLYWGPFQQPYAGLYKWDLNFYRGSPEPSTQVSQDSKSWTRAGLGNVNLNPRYPVLQSWLADVNYGSGLAIPQTGYLLNAAYMRVKNATIGYTLPAHLLRKYGISRLRFYLTGENLFEFSAIKKYVDPEAVNAQYSDAYPFERKYAVGLNLDL